MLILSGSQKQNHWFVISYNGNSYQTDAEAAGINLITYLTAW